MRIAIAFLWVGVLGMVAACGGAPVDTPPAGISSGPTLPTREEFKAKWIGKSKDEVLKGLGKPSKTNEGNGPTAYWVYDEVCRDKVSGKNDVTVWIHFNSEGKVDDFTF